MLYDVTTDGPPLTYAKTRTPEANIYVKVEHKLLQFDPLTGLDPVLAAAVDRLGKTYQKTFWTKIDGFTFGQACLALATRGININYITVYWGPGGVGMSSYTAHLQAMYGASNHVLFDPNIFYEDGELRKVLGNLMGRFIYTGQERPQGTRHGFRQDLLKKFASGEGISARMPYGIVTKLLKVIGWKRIELNSVMEFEGCTEQNFESILRRFAIIKIEAKFVDRGVSNLRQEDIESAGVYERDPDLEEFYQSPVTAAAGLLIQHGFERDHNVKDCQQILINYTRRGGDRGVGIRYMRKACGLKSLEEMENSSLGQMGLMLQPDAEQEEAEERLTRSYDAMRDAILQNGQDFLNHTEFSKCKHAIGQSGYTKEALWRHMAESRYWQDVGKRRRSTVNFMPVLAGRRSAAALFAPPALLDNTAEELARFAARPEAQSAVTLPELYDLDSLRSHLLQTSI